MSRPVILLEFNEIVPWLIDRFIAEGHLPNFKRLRDRSRVMVTDAGESQLNLEPWIQWITVHSGLTYEQHGVFLLDEGAKLEEKCVWDMVSDQGDTAWVCGSMNVRYDRPLNGMLLPDAWSTGALPFPDSLLPFCKFLQTNVQEHTNSSVPLGIGDYAGFLKFMLLNGMSVGTVTAILKQLIGQRTGSRLGYQKAVLLDKLQWDVFAHHYKRLKPKVATFFSNSTAHFQHKYWRCLQPELFEIKPSTEEQEKFGDAILFGYQNLDKIIGDCLDLAGDDTDIVMLSALSQQPCVGHDAGGGKRFYRPHKFDPLTKAFGLKGVKLFRPVMSEQFHIEFDSEENAAAAHQQLISSTIDGEQAFYAKLDGSNVFCGCAAYGLVPEEAMVSVPGRADNFRFYDLFYMAADSMKSGMHHPDGVFWVSDAQNTHEVVDRKVPLSWVAPTLLEMLGLEKPANLSGYSAISEQHELSVAPVATEPAPTEPVSVAG